MPLHVIFFGSLVDATTVSTMEVTAFTDTDVLKAHLIQQFPGLATAHYFIAVNQQMIQSATLLKEGDTVAFMPPFSGG